MSSGRHKSSKKPKFQSVIQFTKTSFNHGSNQTERKNHLAQQRRHKHKDDFQKPYGRTILATSQLGAWGLRPVALSIAGTVA